MSINTITLHPIDVFFIIIEENNYFYNYLCFLCIYNLMTIIFLAVSLVALLEVAIKMTLMMMELSLIYIRNNTNTTQI